MIGQNILVVLSRNGVALAATAVKSQDIETQCATMEKASATQQEWEEHIAGRKSWSINIDYLVLVASQVEDLLKVGQEFDVTVRDRDSTYGVTGKAIMTNVHGVSSVGNLATGSFVLKGSGALNQCSFS